MSGRLRSYRLTNNRLLGPAESSIKSVQRGSYTITTANNSVSISEVDLDKSIVKVEFWEPGTGIQTQLLSVRGYLTSSTTLILDIGGASYTASSTIVKWEVCEFSRDVTLQTGTLVFSADVTATVTISGVDTDKSILVYSYSFLQYNGSTYAVNDLVAGVITNSATLTFNHIDIAYTKTVSWQVAQFP